MKSIVAYFRALLVLIITAGHIVILLITNIFTRSPQVGFWFRRSWARWTAFIIGVKLEINKNDLDNRPAIYLSNHRSMIDPVIQARYINAHIIAKNEVSHIPVINKGAQLTGIIFVKRDKLSSRLAARNETERLLLAGHSVLVYAEGTTGTNQTTIDFKPGTLSIAAKYNIPVIPVAIEYKEPLDFWYSGGLRSQMIRQVGKRTTMAKMSILAPIIHSDQKILLEQVKSAIDTEMLVLQKNWSQVFEA